MTDFQTCGSDHCSACAEVERLQDDLARQAQAALDANASLREAEVENERLRRRVYEPGLFYRDLAEDNLRAQEALDRVREVADLIDFTLGKGSPRRGGRILVSVDEGDELRRRLRAALREDR